MHRWMLPRPVAAPGAPPPAAVGLTVPARLRQSVAVGDIDGDGELEVVFGTSAGGVHALRGATGLDAPGFPFRTRGRIMAPVLLAPLVADEPGLRLVVQSHDGHLYAISGASGAPGALCGNAARARSGCGRRVQPAMPHGVTCVSSTE
jgi:hypothetical protein